MRTIARLCALAITCGASAMPAAAQYAIAPDAEWRGDFKTTVKGEYSISYSGTTAAADDAAGSTLTIGDCAAVINTSAAGSGEMTVLVKYSAAPATTPAAVVAFGGQGGVGVDVGLYTKYDKSLAVYRNYIVSGVDYTEKPYSISSGDPVLSAAGGYLLCARKRNGCSAYVGTSVADMTGGEKTDGALTFTYNVNAIGIGGPTPYPGVSPGMSTFAGFVVEEIAVFKGYYTPDDLVVSDESGAVLRIRAGATWNFAAGETRTYTRVGGISPSATIAVTNAATLSEGTYTLATWTTPQLYTTECAGYGRAGTLAVDGLPAGLAARLVYGAKAIYLRVDDAAKQAARRPLVVWCYGDSITEGYNAQATGANYRILLYQKLEMLGYKVQSAGVYGLSNGHDSVDPSGTPLADQYRWHSSKHGATAGPSTLCHRSNLSENVDTLCVQAGTPDVALLLIGVNDLPEFPTVQPVFESWSNVVARLVRNLPHSKIVVSTVLDSKGRDDLDPKIHALNDLIRPFIASMPAEWRGKVLLADLNQVVRSLDPGIIYSDRLHPDWWGYDQMADGYLEKIREFYPSPDATDFPSQAPIPAAPTADQLGAANKPELAAYRRGFKRLGCIRVEKGQDIDNVSYADMSAEAVSENIGKVGYFVEFVRADNHAHKWVWADMDAFGDRDLESVGLPRRNYQQAVTNLHVCSNHGAIDDVAADDDSVTGWIEFSPFNYSCDFDYSGGIHAPTNYVKAGGHPYDWADTLGDTGSYGCMQVFRVKSPSTVAPPGRPQTLFAFNNFRSANSSPADFGIGNFAQHFNCDNSRHSADWTGVGGTLAKMAPDAYRVKTIEIWTKPVATIPETFSQTEITQSNVKLDAAEEWAVVGAKPIFVDVPPATGTFTLAFDAVIPSTSATIVSWAIGGEGSDVRVRRTDDAANVVVWKYGATGAIAAANGTGGVSTPIPAGAHSIMVEYAHDKGTTVYVDYKVAYRSSSMHFSQYGVGRIALGGAATGDSDDLLAGLKVKSLSFIGRIYRDSTTGADAFVTGNGGALADAATNLSVVRLFGLLQNETEVVMTIDGIDVPGRGLSATVLPPVRNGTLSILGKRQLGDQKWIRAKVFRGSDAVGGDFSLDDDDLSAYRFFKLRAEEGLKTKGTEAD